VTDALLLARLQFGFTAGGHYLFVVLTLGLAAILSIMQTRALFGSAQRRAERMTMVRFWGQLYVINYGMGIVTGLVMELQFGLTWPGLSHAASEVFGIPLAIESLVAFFLESTLLGLWIFGWNRIPPLAHAALMWGITLTAYASVVFILIANGFLQSPAGVRVDGEQIRMADLGAFATNPSGLLAVPHIVFGSLLAGGAVMAGLSAARLRSRRRRGPEETAMFERSLKWGFTTFCIAIVPVAAFGATQWGILQPAKFAAWQGDAAALASINADAVARFGPGDYLPPQGWVQSAALLMLGCWGIMAVSAAVALTAAIRRGWQVLNGSRRLQTLLAYMVPLPFIAVLSGWVFREAGRQPWVIHEMLSTESAVSQAGYGGRLFSFAAFTLVFALLVLANWWLILRHVRRSPAEVSLGAEVMAWT
jgi:cytochrome d ubiquinol oxidase subunit I